MTSPLIGEAGRAYERGAISAASLRQGRRIQILFREPGHAARVAALLLDGWVTSGCVHTPGRSRAFFLAAQPEPGSYLRRDFSNRLPVVGLLHLSKMEQTNDRVVASAYVSPRR